MPDAAIQLVVFDLGHVLIDIADGWHHAAELAGVTLAPDVPNDAQQQAIRQAIHASEVGQSDHTGFTDAVAPALGLSPEDVTRLSDAFLRLPYPGIHDLLQQVMQGPHQTGCLSNTNAMHWAAMTDPNDPRHLPLLDMQFPWASQELRLRKPDPAIYQHCQQQAGLPPEQILFFDNLPENVAGARDAGWQAELIKMNGDPVPQLRLHLAAYGVL